MADLIYQRSEFKNILMIGNETIRYFIKIVKNELALSNKEKEILIARLEKKTLHKIGRKYKLTAERVRQIEDGAVKKFLKKVNQLFLFE